MGCSMATKQDARIKELLAGIPKSKLNQATMLAENAIAIEDKLDAERKVIWKMDITVEYDNGGGQTGVRKNPAYEAYASLLSSYQKIISQLEGMKEEESSGSIFDWNK